MIDTIDVRFKGMERSAAMENAALARLQSLLKAHARITSCHVTIEAPPGHMRRGAQYRVCVDVVMPGAELVASRSPPGHAQNQDAYVALRDAFRAVRRELKESLRRRRGNVKTHETRQEHPPA